MSELELSQFLGTFMLNTYKMNVNASWNLAKTLQKYAKTLQKYANMLNVCKNLAKVCKYAKNVHIYVRKGQWQYFSIFWGHENYTENRTIFLYVTGYVLILSLPNIS
jgi:hypothetical protein